MYKLVQIPKFTQNWAGKKNTPFLLTHSILSENDTKVIFSRKKKYVTFGSTMLGLKINLLQGFLILYTKLINMFPMEH